MRRVRGVTPGYSRGMTRHGGKMNDGIVLPNCIYNILYEQGLWRVESESKILVNKYSELFALYNEKQSILIVPWLHENLTTVHYRMTPFKVYSMWA